MTTISSQYRTLREAHAAARQSLRSIIDCGGQPTPEYVLRADGDTDKFCVVNGRIVRKKVAGWVTLGSVIAKSETPCIVS